MPGRPAQQRERIRVPTLPPAERRAQTIAGIATALLQATQPEFKVYAHQVIANARALADTLVGHGYKLQTNGTDNHLVLWDLRPLGVTGSKLEKLCDILGITINKNAVAGDTSAQTPGGIRLGTSALTSRNMLEADVRQVAEFLHRAVQIALAVQKEAGSKLLKDFVACVPWLNLFAAGTAYSFPAAAPRARASRPSRSTSSGARSAGSRSGGRSRAWTSASSRARPASRRTTKRVRPPAIWIPGPVLLCGLSHADFNSVCIFHFVRLALHSTWSPVAPFRAVS
jgi:hypothetical protein